MLLAILLPLAGAAGIALAGRISANVRETVTLVTAGGLALTVWSLLPVGTAGGRPAVTVTELWPGVELAFRVGPLG